MKIKFVFVLLFLLPSLAFSEPLEEVVNPAYYGNPATIQAEDVKRTMERNAQRSNTNFADHESRINSLQSGKQGALGFTPENSANKGVNNGYAGLGSDGKVPSTQLPTHPQSDWNMATSSDPTFIKNKPTVPAAQIQSDWNQTNNTLKDFIKNKPTFGTAASLNAGTEVGNLVQLSGACTNSAYSTQSTCEAAAAQWVPVLNILCDPGTDACNTKMDIISADEITKRIDAKTTVSTAQPSGGKDGDVWFVVQ